MRWFQSRTTRENHPPGLQCTIGDVQYRRGQRQPEHDPESRANLDCFEAIRTTNLKVDQCIPELAPKLKAIEDISATCKIRRR